MEQGDKWFIVENGENRPREGRGLPLVRFSYRVGLGPHLFRAKSGQPFKGGLMGIELGRFDGKGPVEPFCAEVLRECGLRHFSGVVCRFDGPPRPGVGELLCRLSEHCGSRGLSCYVSEAYGTLAPQAGVLIPTAVSGGSLAGRLEMAAHRFGVGRVALWLERAGEDFLLPSPKGSGNPLDPAALEALRERHQANCFFSDELCARYFTYMEGEEGHFVLFDDLASLQKKLSLGRRLGVHTVFLPQRELGELLPQLLME